MKTRFLLSSLLALSIMGCSTPMINTSQDFTDLEKEYKSFSTKALSDSYVKRMFGKYLSPVNTTQLTRQLEFSRYLKSQSDNTYETSLKSMFSQTPVLYDQMTGIGTISNKMSTESATFGTYVIGLSPYALTPVATDASNITQTSFKANWNTSARATGYKLFVNGSEVYSGASTSFDVTGLTVGTTYTYYVKAVNNAGTSGSSNTISVILNPAIPGVPTTLAATNIGQTSFTANWNSVSGATSYKLKVNSGTFVDVGAVTSFDVTGLTIGTAIAGSSHNYYVQASNISGTSTSSTARTVTLLPSTPPVPVANIASSVTNTSFRANWSSVSGATGYKLYIDGTLAYTGTNLYYDKSGVVSGSSHTYYVQAYNTGGTSANSNEISVSLLTHLTEIQSIPTNGAGNFKFITIGTNNYIISSNYFNGSTYNLLANIYKWNTSTSKFDSTAIQSIPTSGNAYTEFFTIGSDNYLVVTNQFNGYSFSNISKIYKWNGTQFVEWQSIPTDGAVVVKSFKIGINNYLAILYPYNGYSNYTNINIFKWNTSTSQFDTTPYQAIPSDSPYGLEFFTIGTDNYIAVTNYYNLSYPAKIYKWNGTQFIEHQSISTNLSYDWEHFQIGTEHYLAMANYSNTYSSNTDSKIYKWNSNTSQFVEFQSISTNGGREWRFFTIGSDNYLAIANNFNDVSYNIPSKIYKWNGSAFVEWQSIQTNGAVSWEYFSIGVNNYLAVSNNNNNSNYSSKVYRFD